VLIHLGMLLLEALGRHATPPLKPTRPPPTSNWS